MSSTNVPRSEDTQDINDLTFEELASHVGQRVSFVGNMPNDCPRMTAILRYNTSSLTKEYLPYSLYTKESGGSPLIGRDEARRYKIRAEKSEEDGSKPHAILSDVRKVVNEVLDPKIIGTPVENFLDLEALVGEVVECSDLFPIGDNRYYEERYTGPLVKHEDTYWVDYDKESGFMIGITEKNFEGRRVTKDIPAQGEQS